MKRVIATLVVLGVLVLWLPRLVATEILFGWIRFLGRVADKIHVRGDGLAIFLICFSLATSCAHTVIRWLVAEVNSRRDSVEQLRWSFRSSFALVMLCVMLFMLGMAVTGIAHQVGWLLSSPEPIHVQKTQTQIDSNQSTYRPHQIANHNQQSWLYHVLPFVSAVKPDIDEQQPWNSPSNAAAFKTIVYAGICPSQGNPIWSPDGFGLSHFAGNPEALQSETKLTFRDFDSLSDTIFVGEVNAGFSPWGDPQGLRRSELGLRDDWTSMPRGQVGYGSAHQYGGHVLLGDGAVVYLSSTIDPIVLEQLGQRRKN